MHGIAPYWREDRTAPFAAVLRIADAYCHPEVDEDAYDALRRRARRSAPDDSEIHRLKAELAQLLSGDREGLHPDALFSAAEYDDGSDDAFLQRLWRDLYPDEPVPPAMTFGDR